MRQPAGVPGEGEQKIFLNKAAGFCLPLPPRWPSGAASPAISGDRSDVIIGMRVLAGSAVCETANAS
jgi:hypothetical protein